jgi:GNAT superfamily N-acetyltransferase
MSQTFSVRPAVREDYPAVAALLAEVDELHRVRLPWLFQVPSSEPRPLEFFEPPLNADSSLVFVAEAGPVVGVATVLLRSAPEFPVFIAQTWGVLDNIAVTGAWRRRGVGSALTRAAEGWARGLGAQWLELGVYEFNAAARAFYEKLGYLPVLTKLRKPFVGTQ